MNETTLPTGGPWAWTTFTKTDGSPIESAQDVADTVAGSALHSDRAELWGVSLDDAQRNDDGRATVVCYTGNGPNAHNNARAISAVPKVRELLRRMLFERDHGFVYSRDEADAAKLLGFLEGASLEQPQAADAVDPVDD